MDTNDGCVRPENQQTCIPGVFDSPICYQAVVDGPILHGFQRITRLADCTITQVEVLDAGGVVVPGGIPAACVPQEEGCCDPGSLCAVLQGISVGAAGPTDTALFVTGAGCFRAVPTGGGGSFPGYGTPVTTACANAAGVSLLVARADHVHRVIIPVQDEGVLVGSRCTLNFIGAGVTAVDNAGLDKLDITIPGTTFPLAAPVGSCAAPSYAFTAHTSSGMWFDTTLGAAGAVVISDNNCANRINVGASVEVISVAGSFAVTTGGVLRATIEPDGSWNVGGSNGTAGQVLTSNGAAAAPTWQTPSAGGAPTVTFVNAAMSPYSVLPTDQTIAADTSAGSIAVVLEAAPADGRTVTVKKVTTDGNSVVISGAVPIDGVGNLPMNSMTRPAAKLQLSNTVGNWLLI